MAAAIIPIVGSVIQGILGGAGAKAAGKTVSHWGQAVGDDINSVAQGGAASVSGAAGAGQQGISAATAAGQGTATGYQQAANGTLNDVYQSEMGNISPYQQAGQQGVVSLAQAMAPGGSLAGTFQAPTMAQVQATPGYQFQLQQGTQAVEQNAAAAGLLGSGGTLKGLEQYGEGLATTTYQQAYQNALTGYQTNFNNTYNTLAGLAGLGMNANAQANQVGTNFGNMTSGNDMSTGQFDANIGMQGAEAGANMGLNGAEFGANLGLQGAVQGGNAYMQGAQGYAAGQAGQANAYGNMVNGISQGLGGFISGLSQPVTTYGQDNFYSNPYQPGPAQVTLTPLGESATRGYV
jgi:hypothetical protein